mmetsp:Transcript_33459/g.80894  ORF Transcript_33459/g.80894 Transcript_33459/m.80894 type:complete len:126 (-) Transcript_33459:1637-2014(-)
MNRGVIFHASYDTKTPTAWSNYIKNLSPPRNVHVHHVSTNLTPLLIWSRQSIQIELEDAADVGMIAHQYLSGLPAPAHFFPSFYCLLGCRPPPSLTQCHQQEQIQQDDRLPESFDSQEFSPQLSP